MTFRRWGRWGRWFCNLRPRVVTSNQVLSISPRAFRLSAAFCALTPVFSFCQPVPSIFREGLEAEFHFSADDFVKVQSGEAVAHMAPTGRPDDVRMAGIVFIKVSSDAYIKAFRDIERFQIAKEVVRTKRFSSPPVESDLADFPFSDFKKAELLACRPGHCALKMPAEDMTALQTGIDWTAPDAGARAAALIRQRIIAYINRYRLKGDSALAVYYDTPAPYSVAEGLRSLLGSETHIARAMPELIRFASEYPANRPPDTEDFLYWQEVAFGLRHVLRTEHVLIQKLPIPGDSHYVIISKMLFATHYFRAAIEYSYVFPVRTASGEPAIYMATAQRSFVDGMTGMKGAIIRRVADSRSPAKLVENLQSAKQILERRN